MSFDKIILSAYGIFLLLGALMGFKAGSKISLIAGGISGLLVFLGVYLIGSQPKAGFLFLAVLNSILAVMFLIRFLKTHQFMPSGMLLLVSVLILGFCVIRLVRPL